MRETTVETGKVKGIPCGWPSITVFYGIPYAAPPIGKLRWRAPKAPAKWEGVRDCARASAKCPQPGVGKGSFYEHEFYPYEEEMSEDCLYLNVWTPAKSEDEKLPVIFWIHGGAFMNGYGHSAHFDGEHFARRGVILVTINYRLNIFGWAVHPELDAENSERVSGNYGLLDQIAALKWVRRNISSFGGDPENITLAGQSAGAACVQSLICSPLTEGLFAKAIMQSGGGPAPFPDMDFPDLKTAEAQTNFSALGVSSVAEARALSAHELLSRLQKALPEHAVLNTPVIDGYVLREKISSCCKNGHTPNIPCLIGYTADEGLAFAKTRAGLDEIITKALPRYAKEYLAACPDDGPDFDAYTSLMATEFLQGAAEAWAELRENQGKGETYIYCLERKLPGDGSGAFHAADLWYVFRTLMRSWRPWEKEDYMLAYACNAYWANFAKNGNPNGDGKPALPRWDAYTVNNPMTMCLDSSVHMYRRPLSERAACLKKERLT